MDLDAETRGVVWCGDRDGLYFADVQMRDGAALPPLARRVRRESSSAASAGAPAASAETELTLFLIGDAGRPRAGGDPVLLALKWQIAGVSGRAITVFLGDNVYDFGLPPEGAADRKEMERRLRDQMEAAMGSERTVFVPRNHDWNRGREGGWEAIRREDEFIREHGDGGRIVLSPEGAALDRRCSISGTN
jgi:hypothetical protein